MITSARDLFERIKQLQMELEITKMKGERIDLYRHAADTHDIGETRILPCRDSSRTQTLVIIATITAVVMEKFGLTKNFSYGVGDWVTLMILLF
ncbi:hypothetical protein PoB_006525900 [Plakobranchus ocellatus]|uniref:Uncharacterized protein n=1 Tax=Plakobranchus ocellatus TaxID=259542 RepID=A0AAV4D3K2_9GAST|nr:hypothetical protein PoB_006525900 [Plakobranchus ocellatus]